jgi:hypothetical protein
MRGPVKLSDNEKQDIIRQHSSVYDGYATQNVNGNMYPLTVYDDRKDLNGVTVTNNNTVKVYQNHKINEITAKPLNYDEIEPAYDFESGGPQQSMTFYNVNNQKPAYRFKSKGPVDVFELEDDEKFDDLVDDDEDLQNKIDNIEESVKRVINFYINK